MKFKIEKDGHDRYHVYKKALGVLWVDLFYLSNEVRRDYGYLADAENTTRNYCEGVAIKNTPRVIVKEFSCYDTTNS